MEPDPRETTGDLGYDMAHEATGTPPRPPSPGTPPEVPPADTRDDATGDLGYDEAHDFRR
jgi:hypothetical protein